MRTKTGLGAAGLIAGALGAAIVAGTADAAPRHRQADCGTTRTVIREVNLPHHNVRSRFGHHGFQTQQRVVRIGGASLNNRHHVRPGGVSISFGTGSSDVYAAPRHPGHRVVTRQSDWFRPHVGRGSGRIYRHGTHSRTLIVEQAAACPPPRIAVTRPVVVERPVFVGSPVAIERPLVVDLQVSRETEFGTSADFLVGWAALAEQDYAFAREYFVREASLRPNDAASRVGLAIARAASGLDEDADAAMRVAVRVGLNRSDGVVPAARLDPLLGDLERRYAERSYRHEDRWFMVAALRYIRGDTAGAARAADRALYADRHDDDAARLYRLARDGA
jgi:hypothetical protein